MMYKYNHTGLANINDIIEAVFMLNKNMDILNNMPDIVFTPNSAKDLQYKTWYTVSFKDKTARDKFVAMNTRFGLGKFMESDYSKHIPSQNHTFIFRDVPNLEEVVQAIIEVFPVYNSIQSL